MVVVIAYAPGTLSKVKDYAYFTQINPPLAFMVVELRPPTFTPLCIFRDFIIQDLLMLNHYCAYYSGQLRQPQDPESIPRGKNLLVTVPIIFVKQHFCYFYYTCVLKY